jgi:hypothetical protein
MIDVTSYATRQLLRETIIDELQVLPELLWKAEKQYAAAQSRIADKFDRLSSTEAEVMGNGTVSVTDEAVRRTALWPYTGPLHADLRLAEAEADRLKVEVNYLRRKLDNYHVMAKLLMENADTSHAAAARKSAYL